MSNGRNSNMDGLSALLGLAALAGLADGDSVSPLAKAMKPAAEPPKKPETSLLETAKTAKTLYDSYMDAGFTSVQSFDLLKLMLSTGMNK